jgi:hypothetical protein
VLLGLGEALLGGGEWGRAREALESATALALETDQPVVATAARNRRRFALLETDIDTWPALKAELDAELVDLVERGDDQALAEHWLLAAQIEIFRGSSGSAADAAKQAVDHASSAGDERLEAQARLWLMSSQTLGPTPRAEAIRGAIDTLEWARPRGAILAEAAANCERGWLEAIGGDFSLSRKLLARALEAQEDLGVDYWVACNLVWIATVELLAGSLADAEHAGRRALKLLEAAEDRGEAATGAGVLAEILVRRGSLDEADRIASYAEAISAASDVDASTRWRASRARILVERGHLVEAQRLAEEGVTGLGSTDQLNVRGEALFALAEVRSAAGDLAGARGAARAAIDAFDAKGNIVSAQRVASFLKDTQSRG